MLGAVITWCYEKNTKAPSNDIPRERSGVGAINSKINPIILKSNAIP